MTFARSVFMVWCAIGVAIGQPTNTGGASTHTITVAQGNQFDPARWVRIYEHYGRTRVLRYDPDTDQLPLKSSQINVEAGSTLIVKLLTDKMEGDFALNNIYMTATLNQGDKTIDVPVISYNELGVDKNAQASQGAVAFRTLSDIKATMENMYFTTEDLIASIYGAGCLKILKDQALPVPAQVAAEVPTKDDPCRTPDAAVVTDRFRLYNPEIGAIASFFADAQTANAVAAIGNRVFGVDKASLDAIRTQFTDNLKILLASKTTDDTTAVRKELLERVKLVWEDFCLAMNDYTDSSGKKRLDCTVSKNAQEYFQKERDALVEKLKKKTIPGQIFLAPYKAQDGDTLTLVIEAKASGAGGSSAKTEFQFALKNYGVKTAISPSLFFINRASVNVADLKRATPIQAVNFEPAPGVTFGFTYLDPCLKPFKRSEEALQQPDDSKGKAFLRGLGPGLGINFSFLSWANPRDFDPTNNTFTKTTGSNFQAGAGVVLSLFNNKLDFTYGWNLNEDQRRRYFGIGFEFLAVGKTLAGFLKAKP
jgi:hypothetical protein